MGTHAISSEGLPQLLVHFTTRATRAGHLKLQGLLNSVTPASELLVEGFAKGEACIQKGLQVSFRLNQYGSVSCIFWLTPGLRETNAVAEAHRALKTLGADVDGLLLAAAPLKQRAIGVYVPPCNQVAFLWLPDESAGHSGFQRDDHSLL